MNNEVAKKQIYACWQELYPEVSQIYLTEFINELNEFKQKSKQIPHKALWFKDAVIYSLYVDLFSSTFEGLKERLSYIEDLGINCLWLLPVLESPMLDAGFDISDFRTVRSSLSEQSSANQAFFDFIDEAHKRNIKVIFDITMNHTSNQHAWFRQASESPDSKFRNYYIWSNDNRKYSEARLLFKGLCPSNWEKSGDSFYFHRFYEFQPDLNYRNHEVLLNMSRNLLFWLEHGIDGFRLDAIPFLWKEENTNCENLPKTHTIIRFWRAVIDYVREHTLLLAEACQPPKEVVKYFDSEYECNAGYHFPIMPQIFKALAVESSLPVIENLNKDITPEIPAVNQWIMFLRCHDELTLEMVSAADRQIIYKHYCKNPLWDFRQGEGISARLAELLNFNEKKIALAFSIILTLPGTPVIFYGDEFAKANDADYFNFISEKTGYKDSRNFVRGKLDWQKVENELSNDKSLAVAVYKNLKNQIYTRKKYKAFSSGTFEPIDLFDDKNEITNRVLAYKRINENQQFLILNNLSNSEISVKLPLSNIYTQKEDVLKQKITYSNNNFMLAPYQFFWLNFS